MTVYVLIDENEQARTAIVGVFKNQDDALKEWKDTYGFDDSMCIMECPLL